MSIQLLKQRTIDELITNIADNLDSYRAGDFDSIIDNDGCHMHDGLTFDIELLESIHGGRDEDAGNCLKMFEAMNGLTPYLAKDERLWCYLTHTVLLEYSRERWPIPDDDKVATTHIKNHFFARNMRIFERDNSASRLWWTSYVCSKVPDMDLKTALETLLYSMDARGQIMDRSSSALKVNLFSSIMAKMHDSIESDGLFLERNVNRPYMLEVNFLGGYKLLSALSTGKISDVLNKVDEKFLGFNSQPDDEINEVERVSRGSGSVNADSILPQSNLRDLLIQFDTEVIRKEFPDTEIWERLLSPAMLAALLYSKPTTIEEFCKRMPLHLRDGISKNEGDYLTQVIEIIASSVD
jgi:hypothetical protein